MKTPPKLHQFARLARYGAPSKALCGQNVFNVLGAYGSEPCEKCAALQLIAETATPSTQEG